MNRQIATHLTIKLPKRQLTGLLALAFAATASMASADDAKVTIATEAAPAIASESGADLEKHGVVPLAETPDFITAGSQRNRSSSPAAATARRRSSVRAW